MPHMLTRGEKELKTLQVPPENRQTSALENYLHKAADYMSSSFSRRSLSEITSVSLSNAASGSKQQCICINPKYKVTANGWLLSLHLYLDQCVVFLHAVNSYRMTPQQRRYF